MDKNSISNNSNRYISMENKLTEEQQKIYDEAYKEGYKAGAEVERLDNLALIKRMEQRKLQEEDAEVVKRLNALLTIVDPKKIVSFDKMSKIISIGGEPAEPNRLLNLRSEAEFISNSELWTLLNETPKELAQRAMFVDSKTQEDITKGKAMLYTLDTQKNIINLFKSVKKK